MLAAPSTGSPRSRRSRTNRYERTAGLSGQGPTTVTRETIPTVLIRWVDFCCRSASADENLRTIPFAPPSREASDRFGDEQSRMTATVDSEKDRCDPRL